MFCRWRSVWWLLGLLLSGCFGTAPVATGDGLGLNPVYPVPSDARPTPTGAIFMQRQGDGLLGRGRKFQVGDVLTVLLSESTQAARLQSANVSREATNTAIPSGLSAKIGSLAGPMVGTNLNGATIDSSGLGTADQSATLSGSISVTVVDVMPNGNLVVRGEKRMELTEGSELIQVSGVIRAEDVSPNNTVQSRRLANAQFTYKGTGETARASLPGWGTSLLLKFWPF